MTFRDRMNPKRVFDLELVQEQDVVVQEGVIRHYATPQGNKYPSITSVLGADPEKNRILQEWRDRVGEKEADKISKQASTRGSYVHDSLEAYVLGKDVVCVSPLYKQIKKVIDTRVGVVKGIETPLYSDIIKIAGRADMIAYFDGVLSVIDYKTSKRNKPEEWIESYFIQSTFYCFAFEEMYKIAPQQIVIIIGVDGETKPQVFIKKRKDYIKQLINAKRIFDGSQND